MNQNMPQEPEICSVCGREYTRKPDGLPLCRLCALNENARFTLVRQHLKQHGSSTIQDIATATNLSAAEVSKFLRDGRLVNTAGGLKQPKKQ